MSMPNVFSVQAHAMRVLWDKFPQIVDAVEPGGSGDMYAGLTAEEREALAEVTRMGFPPRSWFDVERIARGYTGVWSVLGDNMVKCDPDYFEDFWTVPGYLGAGPAGVAARRRGSSTRRPSTERDRRRGGRSSSGCRCRWRCRGDDHRRHPGRAAGRRAARRQPAGRDGD